MKRLNDLNMTHLSASLRSLIAVCALSAAMLVSSLQSPMALAGPQKEAKASQESTQARSEKSNETQDGVSINGVQVSEEALRRFEQRYGLRIPNGKYWYDRKCGAWGLEGGPTLGITAPGIQLGGNLRADASHGNTGVFVNGRELHILDVRGLQQMGVPVMRGRWWVDAYGNVGREGDPTILLNLVRYIRARNGGRGRGWHYAGPGGYAGSDGKTSYFFDPETGSSVMIDH